MLTIRDAIHEKTNEMLAAADAVEAKGTSATAADAEQVTRLRHEVQDLMSAKDALDPGNQLYKAMVNKEASDAKQFLAQLGSTRDTGTPRTSTSGSEDLAQLTFSNEQLVELQKGALNRTVTTKASISAATASMAGVAQYQLNPFPYLRDAGRILDLIPQERTNAPAVRYFAETTAAAAAAAVAEGAAKPESTPVWTEVTATVRKLAHYTRVNDEVVADFRRLPAGHRQLHAGRADRHRERPAHHRHRGRPLLPRPGHEPVGPHRRLSRHRPRRGGRSVRRHPGRCRPLRPRRRGHAPERRYSAGFLLAKETTGAYLVGSPVTAVKPMLWGVPVILSEYMTENTALVANLKIAATAYIRQPPVVEVAPYGGGTTEFIANQTLVRAEERLALAIHHPAAICLVTAV